MFSVGHSIHRGFVFQGNIISNGTFSKILGPGYRIGWLEVPLRMFEWFTETGVLNSGGSMNNVVGGIIASALELGLQQNHLESMRQEYHERISAMFKVLDESLPAGFTCLRPDGGYFIWMSGPPGFNSDVFSDWCVKRHCVQVLPSSTCGSLDGKPMTDSFRMCFAFYEEERLKAAAIKLCEALKEFQNIK